MNWVLLRNSLMVSVWTTLLAASFGFIAALCLAGVPGRWRARALMLMVLALALPPFVVTNCWLHYLGQSGVWKGWLPWNVVSLSGVVWIISLMLWPITLLAVWSSWGRLDPALLESDPRMSGWNLIRRLLAPLAGTSLAQAAVLTFVLSLNNFAVPAILQVKVFPAELWVQFNTTFNTTRAAVLSWPMIVAPLLLLVALTRTPIGWPRLEAPIQPHLFRRQLGRGWFVVSSLVTLLLCVVSVGLPVWQLISLRRTWVELPGAVLAGQHALWNSLGFSSLAATGILGVSLWVALSKPGRRRPGFGSRLLGAVLWLPFLVPGVLLGIGLIVLFNRPATAFLYQSPLIIVLAFLIRYFGLGWNAVVHARDALDRDLIDSAWLSGAGRWARLRHVLWPQIGPQLAAAWYVIFLLCLWDIESIILVSPPGGEMLASRVFNLLHYGYNPQVNALCLTLLVLALVPLAVWRTGALLAGAWIRFARVGVVLTAVLLLAGCQPKRDENAAPLRSALFSEARIIGSRGTGVGQLNKPRSVAVDGADNLYVVDMTGRVQKFSPDGAVLLSWQMPQTELGKAKGMCRDRAGNVVVLEPHYQRVNHYSTSGELRFQWGSNGTNAGEFRLPRAVAMNSRNEMFVSEYGVRDRVQRFGLTLPGPDKDKSAPTAQFQAEFGHAGNAAGEFNRPEGLCVDAQDRVYVADSCNHRIEIFTRDGRLLRTYGRAGAGLGELSYPYDICVDALGMQYVCEFGNSRIQVFDAQDRPVEIIGGAGNAPGQFNNPWGVALDSQGNLYVADSLNHRVQKLVRKHAMRVASRVSTFRVDGARDVPARRANETAWGFSDGSVDERTSGGSGRPALRPLRSRNNGSSNGVGAA